MKLKKLKKIVFYNYLFLLRIVKVWNSDFLADGTKNELQLLFSFTKWLLKGTDMKYC